MAKKSISWPLTPSVSKDHFTLKKEFELLIGGQVAAKRRNQRTSGVRPSAGHVEERTGTTGAWIIFGNDQVLADGEVTELP